MKLKTFNCITLEHAWSEINKYFCNEYDDILEHGYINGAQPCLYNTIINIAKPWISPKFDFANILGYTVRKWTKLVSNYVDLNYLDLVKAHVGGREKKKTQNYTHSFHFSNKHDSGKDCLISLTFTRQYGNPNPVVIYHTRAVECTKRMIFDFLLIQRIVEYVYGKDKLVEVTMFIPFMFITIEGALLYTNYESIDTLITNHKNPNKLQKKVLDTYYKFKAIDISTIKYKVHARSARGIQKGEDGKPIHGRPTLLAKELQLFKKPTTKHKDLISRLDGTIK